jgi:hypothetical protein
MVDVHTAVSGARMLQHSNSANEMRLRKKLEEQQAAELQLAMELQSRRLMGLQLLDLKSRSPVPPSPIGMPFSPSRAVGSPTLELPPDSGTDCIGADGLLIVSIVVRAKLLC